MGDMKQRSITVAGIGVVGKTELALEFVWTCINGFDIIMWLQADSLTKIQQGVLAFAKKSYLVEEQDSLDMSQVVDIVKLWLEQTGTYVLFQFTY